MTDPDKSAVEIGAKGAKRRRNTRLILALLGLLIVLAAIGLALRYWHWFLLAGVIGLVALYGRYRWRNFRTRRRERRPELAAARQSAPTPRSLPKPRTGLEPPAAPSDASAASIEDELAALKARFDK